MSKECANCFRILPERYADNVLCPICREELLFSEVREYIRTNIVNEYMVAEKFQIPVKKVKNWIKEGRIEYVAGSQPAIMSSFCQQCGSPITFGILCSNCIKKMNKNTNIGYSVDTGTKEDKMRFLDSDQDGD